MATEAEIGGIIRPEHLLDLYKMRLRKLVPIGKNGLPCMKWGPIYDDPNYWTEEKLIKQAADFRYGVATCFGPIGLNDEQGPLNSNELDIDSDAVYDILFVLQNPGPKYSLIKRLFEEGFVVKTRKPKGYRIHWLSHKQHKPIHTQDCKKGFEFEIKTDKSSGLATLPPSRHRDDPNFEYKSIAGSKIPTSDDVYDIILEVLKDCLIPKSDEVLEHFESRSEGEEKNQNSDPKEERKQDSGNGKRTGLELEESDIQRIVEPIQPYYTKGRRNAIVLGLSGILRKQGFSKDSSIVPVEKLARNDGISDHNDIRNAISVVEETFKKDASTPVAGNKYFLIDALLPATGSRDIANEIFSKVFNVIYEVQDRAKDAKEKEDLVQWLRRNVMAEYTCHATTDNKELFLYDESGVYSAGQEWCIESFCQSICHTVETNVLSEVINQVKRRTYTNRSKFDSDIDILNLKNGLLNIHTLELIEHLPYHLSTVQLPLWYNKESKCPNILRFLGQVLKPKDVFTALQFIGYCFWKTSKYEKALLCVGKGANGKGTFLKVITTALGKENVSDVSLQDIGDDKFGTAELYRKFANICADLGRTKMKDTGKFKMLVSGDRISAQHKNKDRFEFSPYAKLMFSTNEIPESDDKTYAYFRRLIIFFFENVFEGDANPNLIDKLTTQDELSGLLNLALIALKKLIEDNRFAYIDDIKTVTKEYTLNADTIADFLQEYEITDKDEDYIISRDLYGVYLDSCKKKGKHPKAYNIFGMELSHKVTRRQKRIKGVQEWCYFGIRLKATPEQDPNFFAI